MTSAVVATPFLTDLDPQAAIKGSRDPLGIQPIWSRLGRRVIGNLTTVSTSVRDFTVLLLGYYFAERVADDGSGSDDLGVFMRWEQLAAYARGEINRDWAFRGTERAKKNLQPPGRVRLGTNSSAQILSNQKTYGLWGLYTVPARSSGILQGEPTRITAATRNLVESTYLPQLAGNGSKFVANLITLLGKPKADLDTAERDRPLLQTVAKVLRQQMVGAERDFYLRHLVLGGPDDKTSGAQTMLAAALRPTLDDSGWEWTPQTVGHLAKACRKAGDAGEAVAESLERIRTAEYLLGPAACLFDLILASDGQALKDVAQTLRGRWGRDVPTIYPTALEEMKADLRDAGADQESAGRWIRLAGALSAGDYAAALQEALDQNSAIMLNRANAAPWADVRDGRLRVRFHGDESAPLPPAGELKSYWRHSYFLDSLRTVSLQVRG
jgi:hypothetical protein